MHQYDKGVLSMTQGQSRRFFGPLQIAILVLVVITALVHLQRGIGMSIFMFGGGPRGAFPPGGGAGRFPGDAGGGFNLMRMLPLPLPILFLLNGLGYLVLGGSLYLPALQQYRSTIRWLLIIFAATTFVLYFLLNGFRLNPIAVVDKIAELTLIVLLFIDSRQPRSVTVVSAGEPAPS
jgi:hypothetical protein